MLRRLLVLGAPVSGGLSATAIVKNDDVEKAKSKNAPNLILKPSELPIYTSLVDRWFICFLYLNIRMFILGLIF